MMALNTPAAFFPFPHLLEWDPDHHLLDVVVSGAATAVDHRLAGAGPSASLVDDGDGDGWTFGPPAGIDPFLTLSFDGVPPPPLPLPWPSTAAPEFLPEMPPAAGTAEDLQDLLQSFWCPKDEDGDHRRGSADLELQINGASPATTASTGHSIGEEGPRRASGTQDPDPAHNQPTLKRSFLEAIIGGDCSDNHSAKRKKKGVVVTTDVTYPFDVVRRGGDEGVVTLADINRRLLTCPARPVRHPVGEFASVPRMTTGGMGPSGKMVVGLTRIYTKGRGTVTIVRTRG